MGLKKGMPDLMIYKRTEFFVGLAIELKSKKGRASPEQKEVLQELKNQGWKTFIINNIDDFMREVDDYMKL